MKYVYGKWICANCGSTRIAAISTALNCEICSEGMRRQSLRSMVSEDEVSTIGKQVQARAGFEDPLVADVRRLRLVAVASKLAAARVVRGH